MDSGRSRTPTGTELDASYMGYVCLTQSRMSAASATVTLNTRVVQIIAFPLA